MALTTGLDAVALGDAAMAAFVLEPTRHADWKVAPLAAGKYLIGSADDCQIRLPVEGVQPHHALLIVADRKTLLKAWDEKTWINDWPVKESVLRPGDRINIGPVALSWRAARADEISQATSRRSDDDAPLVQEWAEPAPVIQSAPWAPPPPAILPPVPPPAPLPTSQAISDQQRLHERRLEELTRLLDVRTEALQQEIDRQTREWRDRDVAWSNERRRAEDEFIAREQELLARRQELETREARVAARENELEGREAAWGANIAEIRSVWELTQRDGEARIREQHAAMEAELAACAQRRLELDELQRSLAGRDLALAETEREFEERQADSVASREQHDLAVRELEERRAAMKAEIAACEQWQLQLDELSQSLADRDLALAEAEHEFEERAAESAATSAASQEEYNLAACELAERRAAFDAIFDAERQSLADQRAALEADRTDLDAERRHFMARLAESDELESQLKDVQVRLRLEQEDLTTARREVLSDRAEIEADRAGIVKERAALAEERDLLETAKVREVEASLAAANESLFAEQAALAEQQAALLAEQNEFETRKAVWQEEVEQHRLRAEMTDHDLADRQSRLAEARDRLEEDRCELDLKRTDLEAAERQLQAAIVQRDAELEEARQKQSVLDERLAQLDLQQAELADARREVELKCGDLDAARQKLEAITAERDAEVRQACERQSQLDERFAQLELEREELTAVRREFELKRTELNDAEQKFQLVVAARDAEFQQTRDRQSQLDERFAQLELDRTELTAARCELERKLADLDETERKREAVAAERQKNLDEQFARLELERAELETARRELDLRHAGLDHAERNLVSTTTDQQSVWDERFAQLKLEQAELTAVRRELELKRTELDDAERKFELAVAARDAEVRQTGETQSLLDDRQASLVIEQEKLAAARLEFEAACEAWRLQTEASRQELEIRSQALSEAEAKLAAREAELGERSESARAETPPEVSDAELLEIDRLTDELQREQEYRRTVESQLEGMRSRHERDAELWNSERTDWMVERDRLERELQAAARQLAAQKSKPVSSDIAPVNSGSQYEVGFAAEMVAARANPLEDDPRWAAIPSENAIAENWQDQPISAEVAPEEGESAENDDPLSQVRAELAKMFDLSGKSLTKLGDENADRSEPVIDVPPPTASAAAEPTAPAAGDWQSRLEALRREAEQAVPAPPLPMPQAGRASEPASAGEEEDSIAAYMERMLARNRKSGDEPRSAVATQPTITMPRPAPSAAGTPLQVDPATTSSEPDPAQQEVAPPSRRNVKPRVVPDKDAVREHLQVFRQVANASARTAVAKHTSRRMWMTVGAKGIVALVCVVAAASFLYASAVQGLGYHWQALGCAVLGLAVGVDLLRNLFRTRLAVARSKLSAGGTSPVAADEDAPQELDAEPADEPSPDA